MRQLLPLVGLSLALVVGCGPSSPRQDSAKLALGAPADRDGEKKPPAAPPGGGKLGEPEKEAVSRKVIYSATVEVTVKDVDAARGEVERLVEAHKGYVAKSDVTGTAGSRRSATYTLKVPADTFRVVIAGLTALGTVSKNSSDSQDVTEEYIDLEGRIKNLKAEEEVLNKFLKETVTNVDGYIKTRDQIKSVRLDVERAEGRLKYLTSVTAMSTVQFTAREEAPYAPEPPPTATTFSDRAGTTFGESWRGLVGFGEGVALVLVALLPWSPFLLIGGVGAWLGVRRLRRAATK